MRLAEPIEAPEASWTWRRGVAAAVVVLAFGAGMWWWSGGARIGSGTGQRYDVVVPPAATLWVGHPLDTTGPVEILSVEVRPLDQVGSGAIDLEVVLIHQPPAQGLVMTTDDLSQFRGEPVAGSVVDGSDWSDREIPMVMVGVTASDVGAWRTNGIEISYRSGVHPVRRAVIETTACALVTRESMLDVDLESFAEHVDANAWGLYRTCR
jgi:hypothetical protein